MNNLFNLFFMCGVMCGVKAYVRPCDAMRGETWKDAKTHCFSCEK